VRSEHLVAALPRRDRFLIAGCILVVTALSWAYLVHLDHGMTASAGSETAMAPMGMIMDAPWRASDVFYTSVMWAVMMVGMMSASAAPVLLLFAGMQSRRAERGTPLTALFGLGYVTVWLVFSVCAALAQWALHDGALLSSTMSVVSPRLGGAILIAAGAYQLTPVKGACLSHCQSPLGFLLGNWRDGAGGALQMGIRQGVHCLGCCWALMCVLFVIGVMNLTWVGALTAVILLEKSGRIGVYVARAGGIALMVAGVLVASR
jgi:predicted metal-binding membrane protein